MFAAIFVCGYFLFPALVFAQQYPLISYTTKDGLISNRVRKIYQDSSGRLFFLTYNGLSVYDAERFTNYSTEDGLGTELINDVMQMGKDSFWIATNDHVMNCLVRGKIKKLVTADGYCPVVNQLHRNKQGKLFAATDEGIFMYEHDRFKHLSFNNKNGENVGSYILHIQALNDELMLVRCDIGGSNKTPTTFLYNYNLQKIISSIGDADFCTGPANSYWFMTQNGLRILDSNSLMHNKFELRPLPLLYKRIASWQTNCIFFDKAGNCWLSSPDGFLATCSPQGNVSVFSSQKILSEQQPFTMFQDAEGILWFNFLQIGVSKLVTTNVSICDEVFGMRHISDINYCHGTLILYDDKSKKIIFSDAASTRSYALNGNVPLSGIITTVKGTYGFSASGIYKLIQEGTFLKPVKIKTDSADVQGYNLAVEDDYGNLIVRGIGYLTAVIDGSKTVSVQNSYLTDELTKDHYGNIWVENRANEVMVFSVHPEMPEKYLQPEKHYEKEFKGIDIRSASFDSSGSLWIGSRARGLFRASFYNNDVSLVEFTKKDGLSDNFNAYLACDAANNIWSCSPSGLDKISFDKNKFIVTNVTGQNNLFGKVIKVVFVRDTAWALTEAGTIIKIKQEENISTGYTPRLYLAYAKKGRDTIRAAPFYKLPWFDNDLSFYFAATSFFQESQIQYSYRLSGEGNATWSEPSPNAFISFVNLAPGNYTLQTRVSFPAGRYADQIIETPVSIIPPWWKTKLFRLLAVVLIITLSLAVMRIYLRRKLAKQRILLEKQQAIQKERTRIATDMHDDLGAGLSRIKFLSEIIKLKQQSRQDTEEYILRIGDYAKDMIGKMGEIVWALNEKNDSVGNLVAYSRLYAAEYLAQNGITVNVQTPESFLDVFVTGEIRRNIFLTIKEALHNVVKHAKADHVNIHISIDRNIMITIADNGIGIDQDNIRPFSNGISNMQKRIQEIGGVLEIKNNNGTNIYINVPIDI